MRLEKDFEELLELLNENKVKYCVVGAFAVAFYGIPRFTKDMDILVEPAPQNSRKILKALNDFGFGSLGLTEKDFSNPGTVIQLGYEPIRVDILTSVDGCDFQEIWKNKEIGAYGKQKVHYIGLEELIKNKRITARPQDKMDVKQLIKSKKKNK